MNNIKVLHLCSYYYGSKLYENLFIDLSKKLLKQAVYVPIKNNVDVGNIKDINNCEFLIKETSNNLDRFFFIRKAKKNYDGLISNIDINSFNIVHAHTLFTNGYMAYQLKKDYNLPYIVAVRNTDVNVFFKYFIHLRKLGIEILKNAEKIIFISPSYLENTINKYVPNKYKEEIRIKSLVIPNGLNEYWIKNRATKHRVLDSKKIKLVYIGEITKNKNIHKVIDDVETMISNGMDVEYTIVGDGEYLSELKDIVQKVKNKNNIKVLGRINDKDKLKEILDNNDIFVMNSSFETFGLSYIEALSRGLPVIYTKEQGIYGYFNEGYIGYGVERGNSIQYAVNKIIKDYENISKNAIEVIDDFRWNSIGNKYIGIYNKVLDYKEED